MSTIIRLCKKRDAFTLVEVLLVVSLVAMTSIALFGAFQNGIKLWDYSQRFSLEEDFVTFLDKIGADVRNSFGHSLINFKGRRNFVEFPTMVKAPIRYGRNQPIYVNQTGKVIYEFDSLHGTIIRRAADYGQALSGEFGPDKVMLTGVRDVRFYYYVQEEDGELDRTEVIDERPDYVQIAINYINQRGKSQAFQKLYPIRTSQENMSDEK